MPMSGDSKIVQQLRTLVQLTQTEAQVAQVRIVQARTTAVQRELRQNAENAEERTRLLQDALREQGGVPDVVTPAIGRLTALVKSQVEQVQPFDEALLGDLLLEHQLLDRSRYLKALAEAAEEPSVAQLADRLVEAHTATVEWLTTVLAEEALGGPAALRATPLQRAAGGAARVANLPSRYASSKVNEAVESVAQSDVPVFDKVTAVADKASEVSRNVLAVLSVGRDVSLQRAEDVARRLGASRLASRVGEVADEVAVPTSDELPISDYDGLKAQDAIAAVQELDSPEDVRAVVRYEETHKGRTSVVSAAQTRLAGIAKQVVGIA